MPYHKDTKNTKAAKNCKKAGFSCAVAQHRSMSNSPENPTRMFHYAMVVAVKRHVRAASEASGLPRHDSMVCQI
jgi:hypothetical protein